MTRVSVETDRSLNGARTAILAAAIPHVVFDGWSDQTLAAAAEDTGFSMVVARAAFPRGGADLAMAFHLAHDTELAERLRDADLSGMRFRDRVAHAIVLRLELVASHREEVRRAAALFALPHHAPDGARAIWNTADTIWNALGDTSRDYNWYTKRATLSAVYSSCVLFWLGDTTPDLSATTAFVGRRIDDVMRFEKTKAKLRANPLAAALMKGPARLLDRVTAPDNTARSDLPGSLRGDA